MITLGTFRENPSKDDHPLLCSTEIDERINGYFWVAKVFGDCSLQGNPIFDIRHHTVTGHELKEELGRLEDLEIDEDIKNE